jgi:hypothetical protein
VFPPLPPGVQSEVASPRNKPQAYAWEAGTEVVVVVEVCVIASVTFVLKIRLTLPSGDIPVDVTVQ